MATAAREVLRARRAAMQANPEPVVPYQPVPVPPAGGLLETAVGTPTQPLPPAPPPSPAPFTPTTPTGPITEMPAPATPFPDDPRATEYEDDSVMAAMEAFLNEDNAYMQLARTSGLQTANRRGLLNSSIAAGTSQAAAIAAAAPLAMQDASQKSQRNLARVQAFFTDRQQAKDIEARERMLATQLRSEEERLGRQLTAQEIMQQRDIVSQQFMQSRQIEATRLITQMNIDSAERMLGRQLTAQEQAQIRDISAQQARLQMELTSREALTREGYATELEKAQLQEAGAMERAELDAETRIKQTELANMGENQRATLNYYLGRDQIYANSITNLYMNKDLPAPARDAAIQQLTAIYNSGADMPAAVMGIQLDWGTPPAGSAPPPGVPLPGTTPPPALPPAAPPPPASSGTDYTTSPSGGLLRMNDFR